MIPRCMCAHALTADNFICSGMPYPPSSSVAEAAKEEEGEARLPREIWENMAMAEEGEGEWGWQWEKTHTHTRGKRGKKPTSMAARTRRVGELGGSTVYSVFMKILVCRRLSARK